MSELSAEEIPAAFDYLCEQTKYGTPTAAMWHAFWRRWGTLDPVAARAQAEEFVPHYALSERATEQLFRGFACVSPEAAAQYLRDHPNLHEFSRAAKGLGGEWAEQDPRAATRFALTELEGDAKNNALYGITWGISRTYDHEAMINWISNIPNVQNQKSPYQALAEIYSQNEKTKPEELLGLGEAGLESGLHNSYILNRIADAYGKSDPAIGIDFLSRVVQTSGSGTRQFTPLLNSGAEVDPVAAGEWVGAQLGEPWINHAIVGLARGLAESDPEASKMWLEQAPKDLRYDSNDPFAPY